MSFNPTQENRQWVRRCNVEFSHLQKEMGLSNQDFSPFITSNRNNDTMEKRLLEKLREKNRRGTKLQSNFATSSSGQPSE